MNLKNKSGQILIEAVFLSAFVAMVLLLFSQLIDLQKNSTQKYRFSKEKVKNEADK